ncbi:hypothetical protein AC249_AIPGENE24887 [Exaiptasia diaphana]|nr:hypothetical protein AC249_AIPGENE24887 [Exaiptasia diaphana]
MFKDKKRSLNAHEARGGGEGSRTSLSFEYLQRQGWTIEKLQKGFRYTNQEGRSFFSSKAVLEYIESQASTLERNESDSDYHPGESSDECFSSPEKEHSSTKRVALAFLVYGQGYHTYRKVLQLGLGINVLAGKNYNTIINLAYPHVKEILESMCEKAKDYMKSKDSSQLGSWSKAVTTSDGCWLVRGFHSQCCTFVIIDFLTGGILYFGHLCMRGSSNICDDELWQGTSKASEGHLAYKVFKKAKEEGMHASLNWQDQDSSSELSFRSVFPDGESAVDNDRRKSGGVEDREESSDVESTIEKENEGSAVDSDKSNSDFEGEIDEDGSGEDEMDENRSGEDEMSESWNDEDGISENEIVGDLSDEDGEESDESGSSSDDEESDTSHLKCMGKPYKTRLVLTCELHSLLYEVECTRVANKAMDIIHEEMGRGHSNLPESKFNVLTRFRTKNVNLHQLHYELITNVGLCQSNMTFMFKYCGKNYHWVRELYTLMHLPIPDGLDTILTHENEKRMKILTKKQTDKVKTQRAKAKQKRQQESALRRKFVQRQKLCITMETMKKKKLQRKMIY